MVPLLTIAGAPEGDGVGTAARPFTGEMGLLLTCCAGPPTTAGGVLDATAGALPFVAVAYEERARGGVPVDAVPVVCAVLLGVEAEGGIVLVIR
jgi:hypothetical protein